MTRKRIICTPVVKGGPFKSKKSGSACVLNLESRLDFRFDRSLKSHSIPLTASPTEMLASGDKIKRGAVRRAPPMYMLSIGDVSFEAEFSHSRLERVVVRVVCRCYDGIDIRCRSHARKRRMRLQKRCDGSSDENDFCRQVAECARDARNSGNGVRRRERWGRHGLTLREPTAP